MIFYQPNFAILLFEFCNKIQKQWIRNKLYAENLEVHKIKLIFADEFNNTGSIFWKNQRSVMLFLVT